MNPTLTERDRIFASLGTRTGLTPPDVLAAALAELTESGERTLADVLEDRGLLGPEERTLLDGLVDATLRAHGGDPAGTLAGLGATKGWDDPLARTIAEDPTVIGREADDGEGDGGGGTRPAARYVATRLHARGGLGEVYLAHDCELDREVALKRIQARHADHAGHRARFLVEAQVTGGLEHPGIVPVYSLGREGDGRPYYAMRFIRGESLGEAIGEFHRLHARPDRDPAGRALGLRRLLGRLIDVCQAMAYAHSRGVLHRDLKPSNIMLGKFGETLVVDWGLARIPGDGGGGEGEGEGEDRPLSAPAAGSSPTEAGSILGTPAYMSPEQANGEVDRLGSASDIYSLGATLYALLAGVAPFVDGSIFAVLERSRRGDFPPPRAVRPDVPPALEAICLKAMALDPAARYPSALALAGDLDRWLADEPVSARREPWIDRLARWRRRHRSLVTAASAVLVVAALALAAGALAIDAERSVAVLERDRARRESARAEVEFRRARRAVDDSFTRVSEDVLLENPRLRPLRKGLLLSARGYYEEFLRDRRGDPALRAEMAQTQARLGAIAEALGEADEAVRSFEEAARLRESLAAERPDDPERREALATALRRLGAVRVGRAGELGRGRAEIERARALLEPPGSPGPVRAETLNLLAGVYGDLAMATFDEGRAGESLPLYRKGREIRERLARDHPDRADFRASLARLLRGQGQVVMNVGPAAESIPTIRRAADLLEGLHRERPEAAAYTFDLATTLNALGRFELMRHLAGARPDLERAEALYAGLNREDPRAVEYRTGLGASRNALARLDRDEGQTDLAAGHIAAAREVLEALLAEDPRDVAHRVALSQSWNITGRVARDRGRRPEARLAFDQAAGLLADLAGESPNYLYNIACNLALALPMGDADEPRADREARASRAVSTLRRAVAAGFTNVDFYLRDDDLDALRGLDEFRALVAGLLDRGFPPDPFAR